MRTFLERRVSAAIAAGSSGPSATSLSHARLEEMAIHTAAPALIEDLAAAAPSGVGLSAWLHQTTLQAVVAIEHSTKLSAGCAAGELSLLDAVVDNTERLARGEHVYKVINGHHRELRQRGEAAKDDEVLRSYAEAATYVGTRSWVHQGIDWCAAQARTFFREGGGAKLARRELMKHSHDTIGAPLTAETQEWVLRAADVGVGPREEEPIRLLDVGACGTLFEGYEGLETMALDLCPQASNPNVHQCDFLELGIGDAASSPVVEPNDDFAAGCLRSLPAGSFDVVVFSLVLSYLPDPAQRGAMMAKARQLLPTPHTCERQLEAARAHLTAKPGGAPVGGAAGGGAAASVAGTSEANEMRWRRGLLLVVDTFSVDRSVRTWQEAPYLQEWMAAVESLGFVFLRHTTLARSHALAFTTAPLEQAELDALPSREPPEMRMRREQRGEWE